MKNKHSIITFLLLLLTVSILSLFGCVTSTKQPDGKTLYSADVGSISNNTAKAQAMAGTITPFVPPPYSSLINPVIAGVSAIAVAISGMIAASKNKQANSANAATATMAQGVVAAGEPAVSKVLEVASSTPHFAVVADTLNNHTP